MVNMLSTIKVVMIVRFHLKGRNVFKKEILGLL